MKDFITYIRTVILVMTYSCSSTNGQLLKMLHNIIVSTKDKLNIYWCMKTLSLDITGLQLPSFSGHTWPWTVINKTAPIFNLNFFIIFSLSVTCPKLYVMSWKWTQGKVISEHISFLHTCVSFLQISVYHKWLRNN